MASSRLQGDSRPMCSQVRDWTTYNERGDIVILDEIIFKRKHILLQIDTQMCISYICITNIKDI